MIPNRRQLLLYAVVLTLLSGASVIFSQDLMLVERDVPAKMGTSFQMLKLRSPSIDLGIAGSEQYWDYSGFQSNEIETWEVCDVTTAPYKNRFPTANLVYKVSRSANDTVTYNFAEINPEVLIELGQISLVSDEVADSMILIDPEPRFSFPVKYGDSWTTKRSLKMIVFSLEVPVVDSSYYVVDAYGTMKCALGELPCLRVVQHEITTAYWQLTSFEVQNVYNYYWITNDYGILANVYGKNHESADYNVASTAYFMIDFTADVACPSITSALPQGIRLHQNYPNPFNPGTRIDYTLNQKSRVRLSIYNMMGQEIAQLLDSERPAGLHSIYWDAGAASAGTYFIRLSDENTHTIKKCVLSK
ncbi:T9SS type A sorting domain-containing protein [candidate division KSB1 bacterium]|nr:T9SS type A sorting domain-containing protein [candidate division KSB1 bacterium]